MGHTDEELMALTLARDERAFRLLMERHMARAIRLAERVVRSPAEADEIGQDAFLRVWTAAPSFDPRLGRFSTWLHRIVVNLALDRLRRPAHRPLDEAGDLRSDDPEPVAVIIAAERQALLAQALDALPHRQRAALALFHMEGLSGREAAEVMQVSEKAFESLLIRARAALRQKMKMETL
jgi:RNA polymerase sigma-70 factor, ECF subfamily